MRALRPYQLRAVNECRAAIRKGAKSIVLVAPTGAGKSTMAAAIAAGAVEKGRRVAWFAHRRELVQQGRDTLAEFGVRSGVHITTYQGAAASGEAPEADVVIFDECHHLGDGGDWSRVAKAYDGKVRVGLTATPERADGRALEGFDSLVTAAQYSELLAAGHIVPSEILSTSRGLKGKEILQRPVDAYRAHGRGSCVVFGSTVKACEEFVRDFGGLAEIVHGKMSESDRDAALARYASGRTRVLCNVGILTEGWDCPRTETIILARGCGSAGLYIQMTGRALRPSPGKASALLLDLSGVAQEHGSPTEDRIYSLDGSGIRRMTESVPTFCRQCGLLSAECSCEKDPETGLPIIVGGELEPWREAMQREPEDKRVARLRKWVEEARNSTPPKKVGWAFFKYKACFGHFPTMAIRAQVGA